MNVSYIYGALLHCFFYSLHFTPLPVIWFIFSWLHYNCKHFSI